MKNIQLYRKLSQLLFLTILIIGFFSDIRMLLIIILPAAFIFANFFCQWICPFGTIQDLFCLIGSKIFKKKFKRQEQFKSIFNTQDILVVISITGVFSIFFETINAYGTFLSEFATPFTMTASAIVMISLINSYLI